MARKKVASKQVQPNGRRTSGPDEEPLDPGEIAAAADALGEEADTPAGRESLQDSPELQAHYAKEGRAAFYKRLDDFVARPGLSWGSAMPWARPAPRVSGARRKRTAVIAVEPIEIADEIPDEGDFEPEE